MSFAPTIGEEEFALFQSLIRRETGIHLGPAKKALLVGRLGRRLRELGLSSFGAYYRRVAGGGDTEEMVRMIDYICTNETSFFREPRQFEFLEREVFPAWAEAAAAGHRARAIRCWSAACSTGEEPYSLGMLLLEHFPAHAGWRVEILATDLSTRALRQARAGVWPIEKSAGIPRPLLESFMLRGERSQEGKMKAGALLRSVITFDRLNLNDERYAVGGAFDIIFCRNVLIYFDAETKARVVNNLIGHLAPRGYLFVGHAESLNGLTDRARGRIPTVYQPV